MQSFVELRQDLQEKMMKAPRGEKLIKSLGKKKELNVFQKGREFKLYIDGELAQSFKKAKDAEKEMQQVAKLMGIR